MNNFQIGETVELKSGGPDMTVRYLDHKDGTVWCVWFTGTDHSKPNQFGFPPNTLKKK